MFIEQLEIYVPIKGLDKKEITIFQDGIMYATYVYTYTVVYIQHASFVHILPT